MQQDRNGPFTVDLRAHGGVPRAEGDDIQACGGGRSIEDQASEVERCAAAPVVRLQV